MDREHDAVKEGEWANSDEYSEEKIAQNVASRCALDLRGEEMSKVLGKGAISPRTRTRRPGLCARSPFGSPFKFKLKKEYCHCHASPLD